jgi:16S rRNA (guanine527-N7)-methyltransferase
MSEVNSPWPAPRPPKRVALPFERPLLLERLHAGVSELGLTLDGAVQARLIDYLALLHEANQIHNLTAIRDPIEMVSKHLLDSLSVLPFISAERIVDVGSGGGVPGIPLLIAGACKRVVLVDCIGKKMRVAQEIADKLGLGDSLVAVHTRIEDLPAQYRCDQVIARAFSSLESLAKLAGIAVLKGGQLLAMKGKVPEEELAEIPRPWGVVSIQPLQVPFVEGERCLVTLQRC